MPLRLMIVEDLPLYREYLCRFCVEDLGHEVVGSSGDADEACELIQRIRPDIALVDIRLSEGDGFDVAARVSRESRGVRCVLMSVHCTDAVAVRVAKAPISGFIDKNFAEMNEFKLALSELEQGRVYYSPSYREAALRVRRNRSSYDKLLSNREQQVLGLIGLSLSDDEIAVRLSITVATVETHRRNILAKLRLGSTPKLIRYANDLGLSQFMLNE